MRYCDGVGVGLALGDSVGVGVGEGNGVDESGKLAGGSVATVDTDAVEVLAVAGMLLRAAVVDADGRRVSAASDAVTTKSGLGP
jgi:hypothetical protein